MARVSQTYFTVTILRPPTSFISIKNYDKNGSSLSKLKIESIFWETFYIFAGWTSRVKHRVASWLNQSGYLSGRMGIGWDGSSFECAKFALLFLISESCYWDPTEPIKRSFLSSAPKNLSSRRSIRAGRRQTHSPDEILNLWLKRKFEFNY